MSFSGSYTPKALDYCIVAGAFFDFKQQRSDIFLVYGGAWAYNKISFLNFETTSMVIRREPEIITTTTEAVFQENCTDRIWK